MRRRKRRRGTPASRRPSPAAEEIRRILLAGTGGPGDERAGAVKDLALRLRQLCAALDAINDGRTAWSRQVRHGLLDELGMVREILGRTLRHLPVSQEMIPEIDRLMAEIQRGRLPPEIPPPQIPRQWHQNQARAQAERMRPYFSIGSAVDRDSGARGPSVPLTKR